jgi:CBS domain-containing protein
VFDERGGANCHHNSSHISSHIVTIDDISSIKAADDIMIQNKAWHLLVVSKERY